MNAKPLGLLISCTLFAIAPLLSPTAVAETQTAEYPCRPTSIPCDARFEFAFAVSPSAPGGFTFEVSVLLQDDLSPNVMFVVKTAWNQQTNCLTRGNSPCIVDVPDSTVQVTVSINPLDLPPNWVIVIDGCGLDCTYALPTHGFISVTT